jgi:hypothetical protein
VSRQAPLQQLPKGALKLFRAQRALLEPHTKLVFTP